MSCVAQSVYLLKALQQADAQFGNHFSMVSCEEMIRVETESSNSAENSYEIECKDNVKEHVMVCLKFTLAGSGRKGYVLLDPGYHVPRPIIVMRDAIYPHTGWFVPSCKGKIVKEHYYQVNNDQFIQWKVREINKTTGQLLKEYISLIYIEKEFLDYAAVTEKRALIYTMKSYVIRNRKGPVAGFYSWVDQTNLVVFYEQNGVRVNHKFSIDELDKKEVREALEMVARSSENSDQLCADERVVKYLQTLRDYRKSLEDEDFCPDLCEIDKWIETD